MPHIVRLLELPHMEKSIRTALVATTVCATAAIAFAGAAHAATTPTAQTPTVHTVTASAQARADGYWTKARMESATPVTEGGAPSARSSSGSVTIPNPIHFDGVPTVGALFFTAGTKSHFCTASVVNSSRGDIILTAAHCVYGTSYATNIAYVPEWHNGISPYGMWTVTSITVAQGWISSQDPNLDFAFLTVAPQTRHRHRVPIQRVTGGLWLGVNVGFNHKIYVIGYNNTDSEPVGCASRSTKFDATQMQFYCNDYQDGTSGGPWILHFNPVTGSGIVFGDIGGYQQGGDYPYLSYSPYYSWSILRLFLQAQRNS
jgi:V8-like Glu-specific endopeptidase